MSCGGFTELIVWREAVDLAAAVTGSAPRLRGPFSANVADQMVRAAESIPANIAEGYGRGVTPDCVRFLRIARSSATELENHLRLAKQVARLPPAELDVLIGHAARVRWLIGRFMTSVTQRMNR